MPAIFQFSTFNLIFGILTMKAFFLMLVAVGSLTTSLYCDYLSEPVKTGEGTFYDDWKKGVTSCGKPVGQVGPNLCALSPKYMDKLEDGSPSPNPNDHPLCSGKKACVAVWNAEKGEAQPSDALVLNVEDRCAGCADDDIDVADDVFEKIAPKSAGRVKVHWKFVACGGGGGGGDAGAAAPPAKAPEDAPEKAASDAAPEKKPEAPPAK